MRLKRLSGKPYLDSATTIINPDAVTRDHQSDGSQTWCFTVVDEGMEDPTAPSGVAWATFKLQQHSFSGQYLDAFETTNDYKAVLRNAQNNDSQIWRADIDCYAFHLIQQSTGRHLDAYNSTNQDFRAVTRPAQFDGTQDWFVE